HVVGHVGLDGGVADLGQLGERGAQRAGAPVRGAPGEPVGDGVDGQARAGHGVVGHRVVGRRVAGHSVTGRPVAADSYIARITDSDVRASSVPTRGAWPVRTASTKSASWRRCARPSGRSSGSSAYSSVIWFRPVISDIAISGASPAFSCR